MRYDICLVKFLFSIAHHPRYIISCSNSFITFDVVTSDLARQVYPKVEGLMIGLELSPDNKFAAAYTNNNEIVLLNTLVSEFVKIENPFKDTDGESSIKSEGDKTQVGQDRSEYNVRTEIQGMVVLEGKLVVYSNKSWCVFDMAGTRLGEGANPAPNYILKLQMLSLEQYSIISWSGDEDDDTGGLQSFVDGQPTEFLPYYGSLALTEDQTRAFLCDNQAPGNNTVSRYEFTNGRWEQELMFQYNEDNILMMSLSVDEQWCIATTMRGFKLWSVDGRQSKKLLLAKNVRNVSKRPGVSSSLVLSAGDKYAVAGIRKELYIWNMETEELSKVLYAHFQRIVDIKSLVVGRENSVITSSIDRSIKVWDLNYIFEDDHHIDKHELTIESVSVSSKANLAVTATRGCIGVWDYMTGNLNYSLAKNDMGAIVTHAIVNEEGNTVIAAESGEILFWSLETKSVIFNEECRGIVQMIFNKKQTKCLVVQGSGPMGSHTGFVQTKHFPSGETDVSFEFTYRKFVDVVWTSDESYIVCYGFEKLKNHLYVHSAKTGKLVHKFMVKYDGFKEVQSMVVLPEKAGIVGLIDVDKGNIMDVVNKKLIKSIQGWGGNCTKVRAE